MCECLFGCFCSLRLFFFFFKVKKCYDQITGIDFELVTPSRRFVYEGFLLEYDEKQRLRGKKIIIIITLIITMIHTYSISRAPSHPFSSLPPSPDRYVFLFNDLILVSHQKGRNFGSARTREIDLSQQNEVRNIIFNILDRD